MKSNFPEIPQIFAEPLSYLEKRLPSNPYHLTPASKLPQIPLIAADQLSYLEKRLTSDL